MTTLTANAVLDTVRQAMLACVICGNVHTFRKANKFEGDEAMTWAAPGDGHPYRRRWLRLDHQTADEVIAEARSLLGGTDD